MIRELRSYADKILELDHRVALDFGYLIFLLLLFCYKTRLKLPKGVLFV
jgi:hypothetical protein